MSSQIHLRTIADLNLNANTSLAVHIIGNLLVSLEFDTASTDDFNIVNTLAQREALSLSTHPNVKSLIGNDNTVYIFNPGTKKLVPQTIPVEKLPEPQDVLYINTSDATVFEVYKDCIVLLKPGLKMKSTIIPDSGARTIPPGINYLPVGSYQLFRDYTGDELLIGACMTDTLHWGPFPIPAVSPQSTFCDAFMIDQCESETPKNVNFDDFPDACKCILSNVNDETVINSNTFLPPALKPDLPFVLSPACYDAECIVNDAYKTQDMLINQYCASTVCIEPEPTDGVVSELNCYGFSYKEKEDFITSNATLQALLQQEEELANVQAVQRILEGVDGDSVGDQETWLVYVILGVAAVVLLFLTYFVVNASDLNASIFGGGGGESLASGYPYPQEYT